MVNITRGNYTEVQKQPASFTYSELKTETPKTMWNLFKVDNNKHQIDVNACRERAIIERCFYVSVFPLAEHLKVH